jgi:hypothetical protein
MANPDSRTEVNAAQVWNPYPFLEQREGPGVTVKGKCSLTHGASRGKGGASANGARLDVGRTPNFTVEGSECSRVTLFRR